MMHGQQNVKKKVHTV